MSQTIETKPKVSIGMPVYNGEQFLHKRIDSLLAQTFQNCELIISDNASTDSTPSICNEYSKKDKRIRYFRQERNMGVIWNFNFVLDQAKSFTSLLLLYLMVKMNNIRKKICQLHQRIMESQNLEEKS